MNTLKSKTIGKYLILDTFSIKGRKHCQAKCLWCGKIIVSQLRNIKKGSGCSCKEHTRIFVGDDFGMLKVISLNGNLVECLCKCGNIGQYKKGNLTSGNTKSCGCEKIKKLIKRSTKHNMSKTPIYYIYLGMKSRCYNPNEYAYKWYGELGITICDEWLGNNGFVNFYNWSLQNGYNDGLSIERINVNKGYSPDNCTWIELDKQHENTSKSIKIQTSNGFCYVKDISSKYNIPKSTIYAKINKIGKEQLTEEKLLKLIKRK